MVEHIMESGYARSIRKTRHKSDDGNLVPTIAEYTGICNTTKTLMKIIMEKRRKMKMWLSKVKVYYILTAAVIRMLSPQVILVRIS